MVGEGAQIEIDERRCRDLLILQLVDDARQPLRQLKGGGARDRRFAGRRVTLDQFGKQQAAAQRVDRGRDRLHFVVDGVERQCDRFVEIRITDHGKTRHQQSLATRAHERRLHGAERAIAGQQNQPLRQPQRAVAMARDQPGDERVGKGPVDGDGVEGGTASRCHCDSFAGMAIGVKPRSAPPRSGRCSRGCRRRTTGPCATRRTGGPPR